MSFGLRVTFPLGRFDGHDGYGAPEWPPSPARLAAALLAADPTNSSVRALYGFDPPVIEADLATQRSGLVTYVAPNTSDLPTLKSTRSNGAKAAKAVFGRVTKEPQGATLTDAPVTYFYTADLPGELARAAAAATYLGRPTSPVQIEVIDAAPSLSTKYRWEPSEAGDLDISTTSPALLEALDAQHRARIASGDPGLVMPFARPQTRYTLIDATVVVFADATMKTALGELERGFYYSTSKSMGADALVALAMVESLTGAELVLPVFAEHERAQGQLLGAFVFGAAAPPSALTVPTLDRLLRFVRVDDPTLSRLPRLRRYLGTSSGWTSVLPVPVDGLEAAITDLTRELDTDLSTGAVHLMPRGDHPHRVESPDLTHLSLLFARPVTGPLSLALGGRHYPLTPFRAEV